MIQSLILNLNDTNCELYKYIDMLTSGDIEELYNLRNKN